ncbi:DUF1501 domain-containing protein [Paludisphaera mucosa]|uniref:DUF1501 domain-containing protein n=1 Tax=Paludisphaera mucosa TaxID=3030827 RepID=A0ABT6F8G9_9BACT|nr:DUF1501 domain-containing protein [Paludisphaera mucosa]MDG3003670.1 DUF1501 domain-containing protein [Paludisphaera mucosa]
MPSKSRIIACSGPSRRAILKAGALGFLGLGLDEAFRLRALGEGPSTKPAAARNCILIWLAGGASHIDTFDPKPDAPADVRGDFKPIATSVAGVQVSEVLPNLARILDRVTLIRSMTSPESDHDRASHHLLTGYRPSPAQVYPSYGSVVSKWREASRGLLPPYVAVPDPPSSSMSGYLTPAYDPFAVSGDPNQENFRVSNLSPPDKLTLERLLRRRAMVKSLDDFARDVPPTPLTRSRDQFADQAYSLMTSSAAQAAFRLGDESADVRTRYGRNTFGQSCLLARRLVEAGVSFVTVNDRGPGPLGWDTHAQNFPMIKDTLAPALDQGLAALIADLGERGLLDDTLVVMMGEFGRTPKINANAGRDHHGRANSVLLAGAGIPAGLVLGKTDANGDSPTERPVTPADLASVLYTKLGIDPEHKYEAPDGRPIRLVEGATPPRELL